MALELYIHPCIQTLVSIISEVSVSMNSVQTHCEKSCSSLFFVLDYLRSHYLRCWAPRGKLFLEESIATIVLE